MCFSRTGCQTLCGFLFRAAVFSSYGRKEFFPLINSGFVLQFKYGTAAETAILLRRSKSKVKDSL